MMIKSLGVTEGGRRAVTPASGYHRVTEGVGHLPQL